MSDNKKLTLEQVAFRLEEAKASELEELINIAKSKGINYWKSASDILGLVTDAKNTVLWFHPTNAFDGSASGDGRDKVIVSYAKFEKLFKEHFKEKSNIPEGYIAYDGSQGGIANSNREVVILMRNGKRNQGLAYVFHWDHFGREDDIVAYHFVDEQPEAAKNPRPRFRKKRKPVPKRSVNSVTIHYMDGKDYTIKNVYAITMDCEDVTVYIKRDITEGILHSQSLSIESKLIGSVSCKSANKESSFVAYNIGDYWDIVKETSEAKVISFAQDL